MKFCHIGKTSRPRSGDWRVKTKFAFLPIRIENETRWMEKVSLRQKYQSHFCCYKWRNESFAETPAKGLLNELAASYRKDK